MIGARKVSRRTVLGAGTAGAAAVVVGSGALSSSADAVGALTSAHIKTAQTRLNAYGYWCGPATGTINELTTCAVLAYQKARGWVVDGILDAGIANALAATQPTPPRFSRYGTVVEVDLKRQLLRVVSNGKVLLTLHATTGNQASGEFGDRAILNRTPVGRFRVRLAEEGTVTNSLGTQYRPRYVRGRYGVYGVSGMGAIRKPSTTGGVAVHKDAHDLLIAKHYLSHGRLVVIA